MKKILILVVILALCLMGAGYMQQKKAEKEKEAAAKIQEDYQKIETLSAAMKKISQMTPVKASLSRTSRTYFDVRVMYERNDVMYVALKQELGDSFDSQLSNGDYLFAGFTATGKPEVYVGTPAQDEFMVYPDWNYTKLPAR